MSKTFKEKNTLGDLKIGDRYRGILGKEYIKSSQKYTRTVYKPVKGPGIMFAPDTTKVVLGSDGVYEYDTSDMSPEMKKWWAEQKEKENKRV